LLVAFAFTVSLAAQTLTSISLTGPWDVKATAVPGSSQTFWFSFKTPLFMVYTFNADGTWTLNSQASAGKRQEGRYEIKGKKILLRNGDGSKFDEWKSELKDNGNELDVQTDKLLMRLAKLPEKP
jgi:hypothetical protein